MQGGSCGDDGCARALVLSVDIEFGPIVCDSGSPLVWVAWKPRRALLGPGWLGLTSGIGAASDCMAGLPIRWRALIGSQPMGVLC